MPVSTRSSGRKSISQQHVSIHTKQKPNHSITESNHSIKLISYNVNGFADVSGKNNFIRIVQWLCIEMPDIICFQQVNWDMVDRMLFEMNMFRLGMTHIAYANDITGTHATVSKVPFKSEKLILPNGARALITRSNDFVVINTQLDEHNEEIRLKQLKSIYKNISSNLPVLLLGNMNTIRRTDYNAKEWKEMNNKEEVFALDWLMENGASDVFDILKQRISSSVLSENTRMDFIWVFGNINLQHASIPQLTHSSHYPILIEFNKPSHQ